MHDLLEIRPPWQPLIVKKSPLNVYQLIVDDAYRVLISFNISPILGLLDDVVKVNAGLSEVINGLL